MQAEHTQQMAQAQREQAYQQRLLLQLVLNDTQGAPAAGAVAAAAAACADPVNHRYSPAGGLPELRAALVDKTERDSGWRPDVSQVLVTNGGKHAVYNTCAALLNPGDEVLLPAPYWTTYPECIALAGGTTVVLQTDVASGFRVTVNQLTSVIVPVVMGAVVEVAGIEASFYVVGVAALVMIVLSGLWARRSRAFD